MEKFGTVHNVGKSGRLVSYLAFDTKGTGVTHLFQFT